MSSSASTPSPNAGLDLILFTIPQSLLLQAGTASILMLVLAQKATVETLKAIGSASEELFRGSRLPTLDFPDHNELQQR